MTIAGCGAGSGGNSTGGGGGGGTPTTVTFSFRGGSPSAVAAKVGSGAFSAQTLSSGKLSLTIPSGTSNFAVAYVCPPIDPNSTNVQSATTKQYVIEANTADGTSFTLPPCVFIATASQPGTLSGSVDATAIIPAPSVFVGAENSDTYIEHSAPNNGGSFSFSAPSGSDRVEVSAYQFSVVNGNIGVLNLVAAKNLMDQPVPGQLNGGNPIILGAADAVTPTPITYNNVPAGYSDPMTMIWADIGAGDVLVSTGATNQYPALPAAATQSGDFYDFSATSHNSAMSGQVIGVEATSAGANPVTLAFPAPWTYAGPTPAAFPTFNCDYTGFAGKTGVVQMASVGWLTGATAETLIEVDATQKYQNGSGTITIPDLSGLAGFVARPASGKTLAWETGMSQSSSGTFQPMPVNAVTNTVQQIGAFVVP